MKSGNYQVKCLKGLLFSILMFIAGENLYRVRGNKSTRSAGGRKQLK